MEALECIKTRRSIRKFTEQPVTEDEVRQVVEAAAFAPSWKNTQIARYIVVTDKEKKDKLADDCMLDFAFNPPADPLRSVDCVKQRCALIDKNLEYLKSIGE